MRHKRRRRSFPWRASRYPWPWVPATAHEEPYQQSLWASQQERELFKPGDLERAPLSPADAYIQGRNSVSAEECFHLNELVSLLPVQYTVPEYETLFALFSALPRARRRMLSPLLVRIRALAPQCPASGALLFRPLYSFKFHQGLCDLCGNALEAKSRFRCSLCVLALHLLLGQQTLVEWLLTENT